VDAQTKLSVVASDIFGVSGRAMLAALLAGERDPKRLAQLARTRLRAKLGPLTEAFCGFFTDQHAFLLAKMLARVDALDADLAELDAKLAELIACFAEAVDRLDEIPGIGQTAAHLPIVELGRDTGQVPDRRAPGVVGQVRPWCQGVRRQTQGQRIDRARQPVAGSGARRGRRLLRHPHRSRARQAQPHPPAPSPRLQGHPRPRYLTGHHRTTQCALIGSGLAPDTASVPAHPGFSDQDEVAGSSPGSLTSQHHSSQRRHRAGAAVGIAALPLVPVALCWCSRPSHQQRQTAHGQQSRTQGMGRQQPKTRTRRWGRRSTTMRFGSYPAEIGRCDGGRGGSTLQPIRQRPATESLHQVSALAQAPACQ
jgi:hypothetical protein